MINKTTAKIAWLCLITMVCCAGCVQRRFDIRSQPEGAFVTIDNQPIGYTPLKVPFSYYGTRQIQLEKDGFKTIKVKERFRPPLYQRFPINFFTDNFGLKERRDERLIEFTMEPKTQVQENLLLDRASDLRLNLERGTLTAPIN